MSQLRRVRRVRETHQGVAFGVRFLPVLLVLTAVFALPGLAAAAESQSAGKSDRPSDPLAWIEAGRDAGDAAATQPIEAGSRPNVILAMSDDQGFADAGFMGHPRLRTPTLDAMARGGLAFARFYTASPVCTPTRASVLTGRHPNRMGAFKWGHTLRPQELTLAEALHEAGYRTGHFGKWHLGSMLAEQPTSPPANGFDVWASTPNFFDNDPWLMRNGEAVHLEGESSMVAMREAMKFIENSSDKDAPFFAVVWFGSPHVPLKASEDLASLYSDVSKKKRRDYMAEVTGVDRAMNRLRQRLRELGVARDTLIWFNSDNGGRRPQANNGPLRGQKGELWGGGIRVPAIIEWPGHLKPGRLTKFRTSTVDIYPTVLDLAGVEPAEQPRPLDGVSLLPLLQGEAKERAKPMGFWNYPGKGRPVHSNRIIKAIHQARQHGEQPPVKLTYEHTPGKQYPKAENRAGWAAWIDGDWKLHKRKSGDYALYNLAEDPDEQNNVIADHPDRAERMKQALKKWQQSVYDSLKGADYE